MLRFAPGFLGFVAFLLWVYAVFDVIATESMLVRNLNKMAWLFLVVFVPVVGAVAWLALGRPLFAGWRPGDTSVRQPRRPVGLEDTDAWRPPPRSASPPQRPTPSVHDAEGVDNQESAAARERRLMEWEAELERREAELQDPNEEA